MKKTNTAKISAASTSSKVSKTAKPSAKSAEKVKSPLDKLAYAIITNIRDSRDSWKKDSTNKFTGSVNKVAVECFRTEKPGKKSTAVVAKAILVIKLVTGDMQITGPQARFVWNTLNKVPKVRGRNKNVASAEQIASALKALGL